MAELTAVASGLWSATGTWDTASVPLDDDTVVIPTAFDVEIDDDRIIGTALTVATCLSVFGKLVISSGGRLRMRGNGIQGATSAGRGRVEIQGGGTFEFDSTQLTTPVPLKLTVGQENGTQARLYLTGTSGNRATLKSTDSAVAGYVTHGAVQNGGLVIGDFFDFIDIGDATNAAIQPWWVSGGDLRLYDYTFQSCGRIASGLNLHADADCDLQRGIHTDTHGNNPINISGNAPGSGVRQILGCSFDKALKLTDCRKWRVGSVAEPTYLGAGSDFGGAAFTVPLVVICVIPTTGGVNVGGTGAVEDSLILMAPGSNPHGLNPFSAAGLSIKRSWFAINTSNGAGDWVLSHAGDQASLQLVDIERCHFLPGEDGSGAALTYFGFANSHMEIRKSTIYGSGGNSGVTIAETGPGQVGGLRSYDNIHWSNAGSPGLKMQEHVGGAVAGTVSQAHHNAGHNCRAASGSPPFQIGAADGYEAQDAPGSCFDPTPGVGDVDGIDPLFVDPTFLLSSWDADLGGAGTFAGALVRLRSDPTLLTTSLIPALTTAWTPRASEYQGTASDAGDIGALPVMTTNVLGLMLAYHG